MKSILTILSLVLVFAMAVSCALGVKGKGEVERVDIETEPFTAIDVSGFFNVHYRQGPKHEVTLVTHSNIAENVTIDIESGTLSAEISDDVSDVDKLDLFITSPSIESVRLSGACDFEASNILAGEELFLRGSGAAEFTAEVMVNKLEIKGSGATEYELSGGAQLVKIDISGATEINAYDLETDRCKINTSGASTINITATQELIVKSSGASSINYKGNPSITEEISGAASVNPIR